jgi:hypothetical protein
MSEARYGRYPQEPLITTPCSRGHVMTAAHSSVIYRPIQGFPGYRIGDDATVWSCKRGRWKQRKLDRRKDGRHLVTLSRNGVKRAKLLSRLMAIAFIGPCPMGMECCHNDGNPANNQVENLRWDTKVGNSADRVKHGTTCRGERSVRAKLTAGDVYAIRFLIRCEYRVGKIAAIFCVTKTAVACIRDKRTWGWLT